MYISIGMYKHAVYTRQPVTNNVRTINPSTLLYISISMYDHTVYTSQPVIINVRVANLPSEAPQYIYKSVI